VVVEDSGHGPRPVEVAGDLPADGGMASDDGHLLVGQLPGTAQGVDRGAHRADVVDPGREGQSVEPMAVQPHLLADGPGQFGDEGLMAGGEGVT